MEETETHDHKSCGETLWHYLVVRMGAAIKDVLLIPYVISIAKVTCKGGIVRPGHYFGS